MTKRELEAEAKAKNWPQPCSDEWHELVLICPFCDYPQKVDNKYSSDAYPAKVINDISGRLSQRNGSFDKAEHSRMIEWGRSKQEKNGKKVK